MSSELWFPGQPGAPYGYAKSKPARGARKKTPWARLRAKFYKKSGLKAAAKKDGIRKGAA